jgi:hypothetical protein
LAKDFLSNLQRVPSQVEFWPWVRRSWFRRDIGIS